MNRFLIILFFVLVAIGSILLGLSQGSTVAGPGELLALFGNQGDPMLRDVVLKLRWPRTAAAFGTGASLALAGAMMQVLLRNPLADPYILGTSGGAAVAALLAMLLGATGLLVDSAAFAGALGSTLLVFALARDSSDRAPGRLLLTGVVIAAGWGAAISLIIALAPERNLRGMLFWMMGDFSFASRALPPLALAAISLLAGIVMAPAMNLLARGDRQAALLGVAVRPLRSALYFVSALLTAVAVTTAGTIGFVGLITPHLIRLLLGSDHRLLLPAAALAGGSLVVIADTLARTVIAPQQLPVGAITAILGVPVFLFLLRRSMRS
jgi:iron complex transport system permease protein